MRLVEPLVTLSLACAASTAQATPSARLVYTRSEDAARCPDEAALRKAVAARFGYDPFFAWARQTVVVQIWRDGSPPAGRYMARVQLVDDQGVARGTREIRSDSDDCPELFGAAALAISIALDASSAAGPPPVERGVEHDAPSPEPPPPAPTDPSVRPPVAPSTEPRPRETATPPGATAAPSAFRAGMGALAATFIGPNVAPGIVVFADVRARALSLGLELQADVSTPAEVSLPESAPPTGQVASALFAGAVVPCIHYRSMFGCGLAVVGLLQAWGWGVAEAGSSGAPFVALGGRAGAEWPISPRLFVRVHVDVLANVTRASLAVDDQVVWSVPPAGGALGVALGTSLP
jgi:hypothetical protein